MLRSALKNLPPNEMYVLLTDAEITLLGHALESFGAREQLSSKEDAAFKEVKSKLDEAAQQIKFRISHGA